MAWGRLADRQDQLRLLSLLVKAKYQGLDDYQPPSEALFDELREEPESKPADHRTDVLRFITQTGG